MTDGTTGAVAVCASATSSATSFFTIGGWWWFLLIPAAGAVLYGGRHGHGDWHGDRRGQTAAASWDTGSASASSSVASRRRCSAVTVA